MINPAAILQRAIFGLLNADAAVKALVGTGIYDDIPPDEAVMPYVSFGPSQSIPTAAECFTTFEVFLQVDCWSQQPGDEECHAVSAAVIKAVHGVEATQDGSTFEILLRFDNTARDDGVNNHAVLSFKADIDLDDF